MKILLFIIGLISVGSLTNRNLIEHEFIGKWSCISDKEYCYEFTNDGKYNIRFNAKLGKEFINVEQQFCYKAEKYKDGWLLKIFLAENNQFLYDMYVRYESSMLLLTSYKSNKKVLTEIDEVSLLINSDKKVDLANIKDNTSRSIIYLPDNYTGLFHILYENSNIEKELEKNTRIYRIPNNGVLSTSFSARPTDFALKSELFYKEKQRVQFPAISRDELMKLYNNEVDSNTYCLDSIYVLMLGFNQVEGERRAKITNNVYVKNIESFKIDTLKNLVNSRVFPTKY